MPSVKSTFHVALSFLVASNGMLFPLASASESADFKMRARSSSVETASENGAVNFTPGELIVKYKKSNMDLETASVAAIESTLNARMDVSFEERIAKSNSVVVTFDENEDPLIVREELLKNPNVEYVQPNFIYEPNYLPSDTKFDKLWALKNDGQTVNGNAGTSGADTGWHKAADFFTGAVSTTGTIVAVIDDGLAHWHADLVSSLWDGSACVSSTGAALGSCVHGYDFVNNDKDPAPYVDDTHGTHVAGTIAGALNGTGVVGLNPNAKIMGLKVGEGGGIQSDKAIEAIAFAKRNGAKVINASWGGYFTTPLGSFDKGLYDAIKDFTDAGGIFVAAAGNAGKNHDSGVALSKMFPSGFTTDNALAAGGTLLWNPRIVSVAATDSDDLITSFSDYGAQSVTMGAPGASILSSTATGIIADDLFFKDTAEGLPVPEYVRTGSGWIIMKNYGNGADYYADPAFPNTKNANYVIERTLPTSSGIDPYVWLQVWCDTATGSTDRLYLDGWNWSSYVNVSSFDETQLKSASYNHSPMTLSGSNGEYGYLLQRMGIPNMTKYRFRWQSDNTDDQVVGANTRGCVLFDETAVAGTDNGSGGNYQYFNGTSMAAPHVAGAISLVWSANPTLDADKIISTIVNNGKSLASLSTKTKSGKRLDVYKALASLQTPAPLSLSLIGPGTYSTGGTTYLNPSGASTVYSWSGTNFMNVISYAVEITDASGAVVHSGNTVSTTYSWVALSGGTKYVKVYAVNDAGGSGSISSTGVVDAISPTITSHSYNSSLPYRTTALLTASFSGGTDAESGFSGAVLSINDGGATISNSVNSNSGVASVTASHDGNWTYQLVASDHIGNTSVVSSGSFVLDRVNPATPANVAFVQTGTIDGSNDTSVMISGSGQSSDTGAIVNVTVSHSSGATTSVYTGSIDGQGSFLIGPIDASALPDGNLTAQATIADLAGNVSLTGSSAQKTKNISAGANFTLPSYASWSTATGSITAPYSATYSMSGAGMVGTLTGSVSTGATVNVSVPLSAGEGVKSVNVAFTKWASSFIVTRSVIKDTVAPVMTVLSHSSGSTMTGSTMTVTGTITEANSVSSATFSGTITTGFGNWSATVPAYAYSNSYAYKATDAAGNVGSGTIVISRLPVVSSVAVVYSTGTASVTVSSDIPSFSVVKYGTSTGSLTSYTGASNSTGNLLTVVGSFSANAYYFQAFGFNNGLTGPSSNLVNVVKDVSPDASNFPDAPEQTAGANVDSSPKQIAWVNAPVTVNVSEGTYQINADAFKSGTGTAKLGDTVRLRATAPAAGASKTVVLTIGTSTFNFRITSKAAAVSSGGGSSGGGSSSPAVTPVVTPPKPVTSTGVTATGSVKSTTGTTSTGAVKTGTGVTGSGSVKSPNTPIKAGIGNSIEWASKVNKTKKKNVVVKDEIYLLARQKAFSRIKVWSTISDIPKLSRPKLDKALVDPLITWLGLDKFKSSKKAAVLEKASREYVKKAKGRSNEAEKTIIRYVAYRLSKLASDYRKGLKK